MLKKNVFSILKDFEFDLKLTNLIAFMNPFRKKEKINPFQKDTLKSDSFV